MAPPPDTPPVFTATPLTSAAAGTGVATLAALTAATLHWRSTASALAEEGIDATARRAALPHAARALGVASVATLVVGGVTLWAAGSVFGVSFAHSTEVGTPSVALDTVDRVRSEVRRGVSAQLFGREEEPPG